MNDPILLEACVETLEDALLARQNGAHRIELCSHLDMDGLTPAHELAANCIELLDIPLMVMIRPREGNFVYSPKELLEMEKEIEYFRRLGAAGIAIGLLDSENKIDISNTSRLAAMAFPLEVTFHKAIDATADLLNSCLAINNIHGVTRILTSGGKHTAWQGREMLRQMNCLPGLKVKLIAAGKVTSANFLSISHYTGIREFHGKRIVQN